jgi:hypothetical protein
MSNKSMMCFSFIINEDHVFQRIQGSEEFAAFCRDNSIVPTFFDGNRIEFHSQDGISLMQNFLMSEFGYSKEKYYELSVQQDHEMVQCGYLHVYHVYFTCEPIWIDYDLFLRIAEEEFSTISSLVACDREYMEIEIFSHGNHPALSHLNLAYETRIYDAFRKINLQKSNRDIMVHSKGHPVF